MDAARVQLHRALKMRKWDDPDLLDVHRRLGDLHYQFGNGTEDDLEQAEKHYAQYLRQAKALIESPSLAMQIRREHPYIRTPEQHVFEEYVQKLAGVYMAKGLPVHKAEKRARHLGKAGCFIATAAFGSDMAPEVQVLRRFRDECLVKTVIGRSFIRCYEKYSPMVADQIYHREQCKALIRTILIQPMAAFAKRLLD
jgi:hypothetical protein